MIYGKLLPMADELHDRLRKARERHFENATDAARALGVKYPTYAGHENGSSGFRAPTGALYARRFKVRFEWLMNGIGAMTEDEDAELRSYLAKASPKMKKSIREILDETGGVSGEAPPPSDPSKEMKKD